MKFSYKWIILTLCLLVSISQAHSLAVSGMKLRHNIYFEPGYTQEDTYYVTNREQPFSSYIIIPYHRTGVDISPYLTITPNRLEDVPNGQSQSFKVKLELPESLDHPGQSLTWVKIDMDKTEGGGMRAYPSVAVSYYIYILYPTKYITWSLVGMQ